MFKMIIISTLVSLTSASAFADLTDCSQLMGRYSCERQVDLELKQTSMTGLKVQINTEGSELVVDGTSHNSPAGDSTYVAFCSKSEIMIIDTFKDIKQVVKISPTSTGLHYTIGKNGQEFTLACHKN